jgi:hypothetical protein
MARRVTKRALLPGEYLNKMVNPQPEWDQHSQSYKDLNLLEKELQEYKRHLVREEHIKKNKNEDYEMMSNYEIDNLVNERKNELNQEAKLWNLYNNPPKKIDRYTQASDRMFGLPANEWYHEGAFFRKRPKYMTTTQKSFPAYAPLDLRHQVADLVRRGVHRKPEGIMFFIDVIRRRPEFSMYAAYVLGFATVNETGFGGPYIFKGANKEEKLNTQDKFVHFIQDFSDAEREQNKDKYREYEERLRVFKLKQSQPVISKSKEQSNPHQMNIADNSVTPERLNLSRYTYVPGEFNESDQYAPERKKRRNMVTTIRSLLRNVQYAPKKVVKSKSIKKRGKK